MTSIPIKGARNRDILKPEKYKILYSPLLLSTLAINILSLALPIMTLQVYDRILPNPGTGTLSVLITGVCIALLLESTLRLCRAYIIGRSGATYEHRLTCEVMHKMLNANFSAMGKYGVGEHLNRMTAVRKLKDFYNGHSYTVIVELAFVPIFFIIIFYISHYLVIAPALILAIFTVISVWKGKDLKTALETREAADEKRFNFLIESLDGVHTIKSFALEKFFQRQYENLEEESTLMNYNVTEATSASFNIGAIFSHIMVATVIGFGAYFVLNGSITTGALIATLLLSGRMMQPVQKGLSLWTRYQDYLLARQHLIKLISTPQHHYGVKNNVKPISKNGDLVVKNLKFSHLNNSDLTVLNNITFSLKKGESIHISGEQGSGKTTLLSLIAGIYNPVEGEILIDGQPIEQYSHDELCYHIGYIRSEAVIFRGTIRDNLTRFGHISELQAKKVAKLLGIDKDIAKLPAGFDTFLRGDHTDNLPAGLKQRLAITRILATKPKIILFDNADRTLDKIGYSQLYSLLAKIKNKVSIIFISEDRNICALANKHYRLEKSTLIEINSFSQSQNIAAYRELNL